MTDVRKTTLRFFTVYGSSEHRIPDLLLRLVECGLMVLVECPREVMGYVQNRREKGKCFFVTVTILWSLFWIPWLFFFRSKFSLRSFSVIVDEWILQTCVEEPLWSFHRYVSLLWVRRVKLSPEIPPVPSTRLSKFDLRITSFDCI